MGRLDGKVVIVTGGGHGIGKAYCLGLAREGARVAVVDIVERAALAVAQEIGEDQALAIPADVTSEDSTREMAQKVAHRFVGIDVLVNNAAAFLRPNPISRRPFEEIPPEEWDWVMRVNLKGVFLCCRAVVPYLKARGGGKIINISSGTAFHGREGMAHYVASKAGVIGFTRTLARELGEFNIRVNALAPGLTLSEDQPSEAILKRHEERAQARCLKRIERPEDLVGTVIFLASSDSDFLTGQTIVVDGGATMH